MNKTNTRRAKQLGMNYASASHRLRKEVMFRLVQEVGKDSCFRCGRKIQTARELSIDHKINWLDNNSELFWDLDNIAFSHISCNSSNKGKWIVAPVGKAWCFRCKDFRYIEEFGKNNRAANGLRNECKSCRSKHRNKVRIQTRST